MTHELKTYPELFKEVASGKKNFEVRKNDRHFKEGDILILKEWDSIDGYTGREITIHVKFVLLGGVFGIEKGYCVMGLEQWDLSPEPLKS